MIERGRASAIKERIDHTTIQTLFEKVLELLETFEDEIIAQKERNNMLEEEISELHMRLDDIEDEKEQELENIKANDDPEAYLKHIRELQKVMQRLERTGMINKIEPQYYPTWDNQILVVQPPRL